MEQKQEKKNHIERIATFIVDKRNVFFVVYIFTCVVCLFTMGLTKVENDLTAYLSEDTETAQGLSTMNEQFASFASARIMISNITYEDAKIVYDQIVKIDGISMVNFNNTTNYYKNGYALMMISFEDEQLDERAVNALTQIKNILRNYDVTYDTKVAYNPTIDVAGQMKVILLMIAIVIVIALTLTSTSYMEVPILIATFGVAALLNMGTHFLVGKICYITNAIAIVLQLALAVDYAIIMAHRYSAECEHHSGREACIRALSKAIPEISSSSLTTISGLMTLAFMKFGMGLDLAVVLIKAVLLSLLTVFTLMPGVLILMSPLLEKTRHKKLLPDMHFIGHFCDKRKKIVVPVFFVLLVCAIFLSSQCNYSYSADDMKVSNMSERHKAYHKINNTFGTSNMVAILVPSGNYAAEKNILNKLSECQEVNSCMGLANIELKDGYMVTDAVNPRQFSELFGIDNQVAELIYDAYVLQDEKYGLLLNVDTVEVPLFDMFCFLQDTMNETGMVLEGDMAELEELLELLDIARDQLQTEEYSRMVVYLNLPIEGDETYAFLDKIHEFADPYYDNGVFLVGTSTSSRDFADSFKTDNIVISVLTVVFVITVLLFTFRSVGLPLLLIVIIQGSIWVNFSFQALSGKPMIFLGALVVSAIQMGANIDYAIVMSSYYREARHHLLPRDAIAFAVNKAFPTVMTSGIIMASSGLLIGRISTHPIIASMGECLGRGTIISMFLVIFVLPCILVVGDRIIEYTSFRMKGIEIREREETGIMRVRGHVRGYVQGVIDANVDGVLHGKVHATLATEGEIDVAETNENAAEEAREVFYKDVSDPKETTQTEELEETVVIEEKEDEKGGTGDEA